MPDTIIDGTEAASAAGYRFTLATVQPLSAL